MPVVGAACLSQATAMRLQAAHHHGAPCCRARTRVTPPARVVSCGTVRVHHSSVEQPPPATAAQPGQPEAAPSRQAGSIADAQQPGLALHPSTRSRRHGLVAVACACCVAAGLTASRARPAAADGGAGSFAYSGAGGPEHWPGVCVTGIQQSPIVLPARGTQGACDGRQQQPAFSYAPVSGARVKNTGTTLQVSMADAAAADVSVTWGGRQLQLLQYHFHTPSEHAVGGARAAMEAHLVHRDTHSGGLVVMAVLLEAADASAGGARANPCLAAALAAAPAAPGSDARVRGALDPGQLLPPPGAARQAFVAYRGSLTTPPCSEGVDWLVWTTPQQVPREQLAEFQRRTAASNARPLQPLNGRRLAVSCLAGA